MPARGSAAPAQTNTLEETFGAPIKQYPGQIQVTRSVKVKAPGKHFNNLRGAEAAADYWATATEYTDRHQFERHAKGWGGLMVFPRITWGSRPSAGGPVRRYQPPGQILT